MVPSSAPSKPPNVDPVAVTALQARLLAWYAVNGRDLPWRTTSDPYSVLVSEIMLQQTQVPRVLPKYTSWLSDYPNLEVLAAAPLADVLCHWSGLGYNTRARRLRDCARAAVSAAAGDEPVLPRTYDGLRALPGVGPYTARAVLVFAHNEDVAAVDANVRRVLVHELGLDPRLPDRGLQVLAEAMVPPGRSRDWHNALMDYGSLVLTARATGIPARTRQGKFEGSRRWYRSRLLDSLLASGPRHVDELAAELGLSCPAAGHLVDALQRDGLVRRDGDAVSVA
jgi:A/G-specific adenine glycosylase